MCSTNLINILTQITLTHRHNRTNLSMHVRSVLAISTRNYIKLVIRLSVNRLPVKLPITGCIFKLQIIDVPTFFFTHTGKQRHSHAY